MTGEFLSPAIVLAALVKSLGGGELVVAGMQSLVVLGGLSQILAAWYLHEGTSRRRYLLRVNSLGILSLIFLAVAIWILAKEQAALLLYLLLALIFLRALLEPAGWPAQLDLERTLIPADIRSWIFSLRGVLSALAGLAAGAVTHALLKNQAYPTNFALVIVAASLSSLITWWAVYHLKESVRPLEFIERPGPVEFLRTMSQILRPGAPDGREFRSYIFLRHLVFFSRCAFSFFTLHALDHFHMDLPATAFFVMALSAGRLAGGLCLTFVPVLRRKSHRILAFALISGMLGNGAALMSTQWEGLLLSFILQGFFLEALLVADPLFMMEYTPPRYAVLGMTLTMVALYPMNVALPMVSGFIYQRFGFTCLAALALMGGLAALILLRSFTGSVNQSETMEASRGGFK